jgi:hypothetical protein
VLEQAHHMLSCWACAIHARGVAPLHSQIMSESCRTHRWWPSRRPCTAPTRILPSLLRCSRQLTMASRLRVRSRDTAPAFSVPAFRPCCFDLCVECAVMCCMRRACQVTALAACASFVNVLLAAVSLACLKACLQACNLACRSKAA